MNPFLGIPPDLKAALEFIYEEIMWLAVRPNVTSSRARAWYTHVMAESVKRQIRQFSGQVSQSAVALEKAELRLEHYGRIQTTLTGLVERHRQQKQPDPEEFVRTVVEQECVHIVTREENYKAMKAKGDYKAAGIDLVSWCDIPLPRRKVLWRTMLHGRVANAAAFECR